MSLVKKKHAQFAEAYSDYYSAVYGAVYSKVRSTDVADDLVQEVFIRFFENMEKIESKDKIRAWLYSTVRNVLFSYYKKNSRKKDEVAIPETDTDLALSYVNGFRDTRLIIEQAIESISDHIDRSLFDLIAIQYYTYEKAGEAVGLSKRQVKYRYNLIISKILDYLRKKGLKNLEDLL